VVEYVVSHYNYWIVVLLMMVGLYAVFASPNKVKRLAGLGVFQTSVFLFYISMGKVSGGIPPILPETEHGGGHEEAAAGEHAAEQGAEAAHAADGHAAIVPDNALELNEFSASALDTVYSNPLPHVLILTAIVVGVATLAVGLALVVLIREAYGTIEDDEITRAEYDAETAGSDA
jgi:multicomponent Na+:H+ antiporter subunit C